VGQRLGEDQPDLAERSTWCGLWVAMSYMTLMAAALVLLPGPFLEVFRSHDADPHWPAVSIMVPVLLRFIACYTLFDSMNLVFSFALRGAGDTRFVTGLALALSWPIMVVPTWAAWRWGWGLYWAWGFASLYIVSLAFAFLARFLQGRWRSMRVIEAPAQLTAEANQLDVTSISAERTPV
jgi:MATE family multidrug resistance protein